MKVFICVRDSDSLVTGVYKLSIEAPSGHTVFEEEYKGSTNWGSPHMDVFRDGFEDYRTVDNSGV